MLENSSLTPSLSFFMGLMKIEVHLDCEGTSKNIQMFNGEKR
jgi:hypothetical protein